MWGWRQRSHSADPPSTHPRLTGGGPHDPSGPFPGISEISLRKSLPCPHRHRDKEAHRSLVLVAETKPPVSPQGGSGPCGRQRLGAALGCFHAHVAPCICLKIVALSGTIRRVRVCYTMAIMSIVPILKDHKLTERYPLYNIKKHIWGVGTCHENKRK